MSDDEDAKALSSGVQQDNPAEAERKLELELANVDAERAVSIAKRKWDAEMSSVTALATLLGARFKENRASALEVRKEFSVPKLGWILLVLADHPERSGEVIAASLAYPEHERRSFLQCARSRKPFNPPLRVVDFATLYHSTTN